MAKEDFNFEELNQMTFNDYKNKTLKDALLKKCKGFVSLPIFTVGSKKKLGILIPFLKETDAKAALKVWQDMKPSKLKLATCKASAGKLSTLNGVDVTLTITKGIKDTKKVEESLQSLFTILKKNLTVGEAKEEEEETTSGTPESSTDEKTTEGSGTPESTVDTAKKAKLAKTLQRVSEGAEKVEKSIGKAPKDKLDASIEKLLTALDTLVEEAKADGTIDTKEQTAIDALVKKLNDLKATASEGGEKKGKKLSTEQRAKITENIGKIDERLKKIMEKLKM